MEGALFIVGFIVSLVGAHFISNAVYTRLLKSRKKWVAVTGSFIMLLAGFVIIGGIILSILFYAFPFNR